jgi:hypothetical protein
MISPMFNWKSVMQLESLVTLHCVDNTIAAINKILDNGSSQVDVYDLLHKSIGDAISDLVIGRCFNSLKKPNFPATKLSGHIVNSWGLKFGVPFLGSLKSRHHPIINKSIIDELKDRREGKYRKDILQSLIDAKDLQTNSTFTDEEIIEEASALILAGMETTAISIIWALYNLLKTPETYIELSRELISTFPDINNHINYDMCKDLPYLTSVIHESLRLKTPGSCPLPRVVPKGGISILGHFLPAGVSLLLYFID